METAQLQYFLVACQMRSQAHAAKVLGISPSTLSQSINDLERELGLELFARHAAGHHATAQARLIYQTIEAAVRRLSVAERYLRLSGDLLPSVFRVRSSLRFALGRISKAALAAAVAVERDHPSTFVDVQFSSPMSALPDVLSVTPADGEGADLEIDYAVAGAPAAADILLRDPRVAGAPAAADILLRDPRVAGAPAAADILLRDPWVAVVHPQADGSDAVVNASDYLLPDLPDTLIAAAHALCESMGLPPPHPTGTDAGSLADLALAAEHTCLLMPQSMVSDRVLQDGLLVRPLTEAPPNFLLARATRAHPVLARYLAELKTALGTEGTTTLHHARLTVRQLKYLIAVLDELNLTAAAKVLNISQPAVSAQLHKLERLVGRELFHRRRPGLMRAPGIGMASPMLGEAMAAVKKVGSRSKDISLHRRDRLSVGIIPFAEGNGRVVTAFGELVREWRRSNPAQQLQILVAPSTVLHLWVKTRQVDIALVEDVDPRFPRLDLRSRDRLVLVTGSASTLRLKDTTSLREAADFPLVLPSRRFGLRAMIDRAATSARVRLSPDLISDSPVLTLSLIETGEFATIMPYETIRKHVLRGEVTISTICDPSIWRELSIIYSSDLSLSDSARGFIARFRTILSESRGTDLLEDETDTAPIAP
jgi:LysR family transcriptional regulator, nitrogen assimilation regulatory protein